ncbi:hypothetical protein GJ744_008395 [Endocarpon pusillum]|uniref:Uncharacterized protein n=1 Tax=Endocarpon pusillum TaxID=364733 RepID=A0A8H7APV5_9EURO|nr:hypothetical protein GJ744_008395 [Endocarpon pusillum]
MPRISKNLPLAALLAAGANAQMSTSSVVLNPSDTAVTTVTFSTCPSSTASITTITNPHTSTYTGAPRPGWDGDVTTYVTVCPGFCTGGPSCTGGLGPTTHTVTATCPCHEVAPGGVGPGMMTTVAVCDTCGMGGTPMTATLHTPIPAATGDTAAPGTSSGGSDSGAAPGGSPAGASTPGSSAAPGTGSGSSAPGSGVAPGGSGAGAALGGSAAGAGTPGSSMPGMGSGAGSSMPGMGSGASPGSPSGAAGGSKYPNNNTTSPSMHIGSSASPTPFPGAASRLPVAAGLLSTFAGLCGILAFVL